MNQIEYEFFEKPNRMLINYIQNIKLLKHKHVYHKSAIQTHVQCKFNTCQITSETILFGLSVWNIEEI